MDPPKPFPILRLPFLAIEEVFKAMHPFEIINFSTISKRAKTISEKMALYSKYAFRFYIGKTLQIEFRGTDNLVSCTYVMTSDEEMDGKIVEKEKNNYIRRGVYNYSKDPIEEWKQLCIHVLEVFKKQTIDVLYMTMDELVDQNVSIIDFLKTSIKSVDDCHLYEWGNGKNVNEHTAYFLNNITINAKLISLLNIMDKNFEGVIPKNLNDLHIHYSQWIGFEKLLEIGCKHVVLRNDRITNEEWNLFLKKWIAMETNQNLEYLELDKRKLDIFRDRVLHDISHEIVDEGVKRVLKIRFNETEEISGGIDIKRIDGKTATFFVYRKSRMQFHAMSIH